jgi:hypothetical protein
MAQTTATKKRWIPSGYDQSILIADHNIEVYYSTDKKVAIGYAGKSLKSSFHYNYKSRTVEQMMAHVNSLVKQLNDRYEIAANEAAAKKAANATMNAADHFKVGDIIYNQWGWEQTNIEFYVVTKVTAKTISVAELEQEMESACGSMSGHVTTSGKLLEGGDSYNLRISMSRGNAYIVTPKKYYSMAKWDGKPKYRSWYA